MTAPHPEAALSASPTPTDAQPKAASPVGDEALREARQFVSRAASAAAEQSMDIDDEDVASSLVGWEALVQELASRLAPHPTTGQETVATSLKLPPFSEVLAAIQERKCHDPEHDARVLDYAAIEASGAETVATPRDGGVREALIGWYGETEEMCRLLDADLPDNAEVYVVGARRSRYQMGTYGDHRRAALSAPAQEPSTGDTGDAELRREVAFFVSCVKALMRHTNPTNVNEGHAQQWFAVSDAIHMKIEPLLSTSAATKAETPGPAEGAR